VLLLYDGVRRVVTQSQVATAVGVEESVSREQLTDSFGRLREVLEPSAPGGSMASTTYSYDVGGRLTRIFTDDPNSTYDQVRELTYDTRGFLLAERHPEKGLGGNGWVSYSNYDPQGNVGRKVDGPNTLDYVYDAVGRLLRVEEVDQGNRPLKEYVYDGATGLGAEKVWKAIRHNYVDLPWQILGQDDVVVTETYTYNGPAGQVSERLTQIDPMGYTFSQSFGYEETGKLASLGYPDCLHGLCPGNEPARTVDYEYDLGFLTAVPGWADSIAYHQNGLWSEVHHANGVLDDQNRDADGLPRPKRIRTFGALDAPGGNPADFDTFVYSYDGSGNIKSIGPNDYLYDKVGRLVQGDAAGQTQQYAFDTYGNINSITTITGGLPSTYMTATNPSTNRLQDAIYDDAGSLTAWSSFTSSYDALNRMTAQTYPGGSKTYIYTADGERIWVMDDASDLTETVHLGIPDPLDPEVEPSPDDAPDDTEDGGGGEGDDSCGGGTALVASGGSPAGASTIGGYGSMSFDGSTVTGTGGLGFIGGTPSGGGGPRGGVSVVSGGTSAGPGQFQLGVYAGVNVSLGPLQFFASTFAPFWGGGPSGSAGVRWGSGSNVRVMLGARYRTSCD